MGFTFAVESWAPEYGAQLEPGDTPNRPQPDVDVAVERERTEWAPIAPPPAGPEHVAFVDGIQRIDARVWITNPDGSVRMGICASYAAGVVRCNGVAKAEAIVVGRSLIAPQVAAGIDAMPGVDFQPCSTATDAPEVLQQALEGRRRELEVEAATRGAGAELVVLDGSLSGRTHVGGAIGYLKTHQVRYLPDDLHLLVGKLGPGERTPVFMTTTNWSRYSWYLRLPGPADHPWSGIVRCEAAETLTPAEAIELAGMSAATLPRYASAPHKDPRAPQNLYPIAGLERELRRYLGDQQLLYRALRQAAARTAAA
ncbi:MAG: hypothetical protein IT303_10370 [Dehalococcoidia bacterium]|nr:hypothetical protein [Dehalococcoidia bacterium]